MESHISQVNPWFSALISEDLQDGTQHRDLLPPHVVRLALIPGLQCMPDIKITWQTVTSLLPTLNPDSSLKKNRSEKEIIPLDDDVFGLET